MCPLLSQWTLGLAVVNDAATHGCTNGVLTSSYPAYIPRSGAAAPSPNSPFSDLRDYHIVSQCPHHYAHPAVRGLAFLHILHDTDNFIVFTYTYKLSQG